MRHVFCSVANVSESAGARKTSTLREACAAAAAPGTHRAFLCGILLSGVCAWVHERLCVCVRVQKAQKLSENADKNKRSRDRFAEAMRRAKAEEAAQQKSSA